jgi:hypothetical protein
MMPPASAPSVPEASPQRRGHVGLVTTLLVLATVIGILASFAVWSARQLLEDEQWEQTSSQLLEDPDIREAVGTYIVDQLFENVDIQGQIAETLPPKLAPLAGPATGALRQLAYQRAPIFLERPQVQAIWEGLNLTAHERFVAIVNGDAPALNVSGEDVFLDLGVIVRQLGEELGISAAAKIPEGVAQLKVMNASDLSFAQKAVKALRGSAYILSAIALLLMALAVYLARGWRRVAVRSSGFAFIAIGAFVLLGRNLVTSYVVDALAGTAATKPATEATLEISTTLLGDLGAAMIGYGVAIIIGAWLAGPGAIASAVRRSITPFLRDRRILYPILIAIVLLVFWWSPTEGTRRLIPSLVLIALLVGGAEALRRQAIAEFPHASLDSLSHWWAGQFDRLRARAKTGLPQRNRPAGESAPPDRITQLERLAALHDSGVLSDEELAREKQLLNA